MTSHDLPIAEIKLILEKDKESMLEHKKHEHRCSYDLVVHGQTKYWKRCKCGKWEDQ